MTDMQGAQDAQDVRGNGPNTQDAKEVNIRGFNRKTVLVGLVIALLFIGGGMYAWQGSMLKGSIGTAVQTVGIDKISQKLIQNQNIRGIGENQNGNVSSFTIQRNKTGFTRIQNSSLSKPFDTVAFQEGSFQRDETYRVRGSQEQGRQVIQVVHPNGGETFCLGEIIDVVWKYQGVTAVRVLLQSDYGTYNFGVRSAAGEGVQPTISASKEGLYRIVVQDAQAGNGQDESNDYFAIKDCTE